MLGEASLLIISVLLIFTYQSDTLLIYGIVDAIVISTLYDLIIYFYLTKLSFTKLYCKIDS